MSSHARDINYVSYNRVGYPDPSEIHLINKLDGTCRVRISMKRPSEAGRRLRFFKEKVAPRRATR